MTMSSLWCIDDDEQSVSCPVSCVSLFSDVGLERSPKSHRTVLLLVLSCFSPLNGLEMSPFTECDVWNTGVLKGIQNSLCRLILKGLIPEGSLPWRIKALSKWCKGLEMSPGFTVSSYLEITNFDEGSLPWRFNTVNLKVVSHGECWGFERSQLEQFSAVYKHRVLKWVDLMYHRDLERSQVLMNCCIGYCDGLEMSQFALISSFPLKGLKKSQMTLVKGLKMGQCAPIHWIPLPKGLERSQFVFPHCSLSWFWLSYPYCMVMYCCVCSFSASTLAAWGMLCWAPW